MTTPTKSTTPAKPTTDIRLGICCLNTELREQKPTVFCSRGVIRRTYNVDKVKELAELNIKDIVKMARWNKRHNISVFRLSSSIFPRFTDAEVESYTIDFARDLLKLAGDYCRERCPQRFLMHPGQYNQVGANTRKVFESTVLDLSHHADILDAMGVDENGVLIVHGGGMYGDKEGTIRRWIEQYDDLPKNVRNRLVLENCEKCYNTRDCLTISEETGVPVVYDCHHYDCYNILHPDEVQETPEELLPEVFDTWGSKRVVMHVSEQGSGKVGHHSDFISRLPQYMIDAPTLLNRGVDIEVEAKMKEQAIMKLYEVHSDIFTF